VHGYPKCEETTIACEDGTSEVVFDEADGATGLQGPQGEPGPQGSKGDRRDAGPQGNDVGPQEVHGESGESSCDSNGDDSGDVVRRRLRRCVEDGLYWVDPDGEGGTEAFQVHCNQTSEVFGLSGGWTLFLNNADTNYLGFDPVIAETYGASSDAQ